MLLQQAEKIKKQLLDLCDGALSQEPADAEVAKQVSTWKKEKAAYAAIKPSMKWIEGVKARHGFTK